MNIGHVGDEGVAGHVLHGGEGAHGAADILDLWSIQILKLSIAEKGGLWVGNNSGNEMAGL